MKVELRVLHLLVPGRFGGLERVVHSLAVGRQRAPTQVLAILEPEAKDHPLVVALRRDGVAVASLPLPGRSYFRERRAVAEWCARFRPDVVHTHGYRADVVDSGVVRRIGLPTVTTVHGFTGGGWKNRFYERLQRRAFRRMTAVVAVSRPQLEALARDGVERNRLVLIPNGWDGQVPTLDREQARRVLGLPLDRFVVGWVGRIGPEKGLDVLLDALAQPVVPDLLVSVVGDGRARAASQQKAMTLGLASRVVWHGAVDDAGRLFRAFDCFVLSSRTEGVPIVLFEAMAARVPIVATAVGGVPDVVSSMEALLVSPEDPMAVAAAIKAVHDDPAGAADRIQAAGVRLRRDFGAEHWIERYEAVYRSAVSRAAPPSRAGAP